MIRTLLLMALLSAPVLLYSCGSGQADSNAAAATDSTRSDSLAVETTAPESEERPGKRNGHTPVEITPLVRGDIASYLLYSSTLETEQLIDVYPRIGGLVEAIYAEESNRVSKGQRLLQIEKDVYELDEQNARLEFEKQKTNFERIKALQDEDLMSDDEYENARLAMEQARIAWKRAKLNLEYTTLTAPISGVVGERLVRLGDRVNTTDKLFSIANLDEKIVRAYVPQSEFARIYERQEAVIETDVMPGRQFKGYVKRRSPIIDPQSGTFKVTVAVPDPEGMLSPGMFVNAQLIIDTHTDTRLIPKSALIYENERTYFYTVEADSAVRVELQRGFEDAEKVEVLNPIADGTPIVVLGQNGLKDGTPVRISDRKSYPWQTPQAEASR